MRRQTTQILKVLARSYSAQAISSMAREVASLSQSEIKKLIEEDRPPTRARASRGPKTVGSSDSSPSGRIVHLLKGEAGLTDKESIKALVVEVSKNRRLPTVSTNTTLLNWVKRVMIHVPPGELVSAALTVGAARQQSDDTRFQGRRSVTLPRVQSRAVPDDSDSKR